MSRELPAMSLTGEQVAELIDQIRDMVDPITGVLEVYFPEDDPARLLDASPDTPYDKSRLTERDTLRLT